MTDTDNKYAGNPDLPEVNSDDEAMSAEQDASVTVEPETETAPGVQEASDRAVRSETDRREKDSGFGEDSPHTGSFPEEHSDNNPDEHSSEPDAPAAVSSPSAAPVYRWSFEEQLATDLKAEKKKRRNGTLIYAIIVTVLFAVCFVILGVLLITGYSPSTGGDGTVRTVFVKKGYDSDSGALSIPEIAEKCTPFTVGVSVTLPGGSGVGTGIIMSADGYIATNYHVIDDAQKIKVILCDSTQFTAEFIGGDELSDLALLKIDPGSYKLTVAEFGDSDSVIVGEDVVAIGNPAGLDYAGTVTSGIISAINRDVKIYDSNGLVKKRMTLLQTSANLNPGNSGGPLINQLGQVIGINTMKLAEDYEGMGFAIPSNGAVTILSEIKEKGSYSGSAVAEKGVSLGVTCMDVEAGKDYTLDEAGTSVTAGATGAYIISVGSGVSAEGYLKVGDIITKIDGKRVETTEEIRSILFRHHVGDTVELNVFRNGTEITVKIPLK